MGRVTLVDFLIVGTTPVAMMMGDRLKECKKGYLIMATQQEPTGWGLPVWPSPLAAIRRREKSGYCVEDQKGGIVETRNLIIAHREKNHLQQEWLKEGSGCFLLTNDSGADVRMLGRLAISNKEPLEKPAQAHTRGKGEAWAQVFSELSK